MLHVLLDAWTNLLRPPTGQDKPRTAASPGGSFVRGHFQSGNASLSYKLFVPGAGPAAPLPLLLMLHGCGQDADDFAAGTGMNALAQQHGFLVLYPEQPCEANWNRCWNWFDGAHHRRGQGEPDLLASLTKKIMAGHAVDPARVYAAGLSAGGAMAVILGRTYPDIFAAVGSHSGLAHGSATDSAGAFAAMRDGAAMPALAGDGPQHRGVPVIVFHGDMDTTVNVRNSAALVEQTVAGHAGQGRGPRQPAVSEERGERMGRLFTRRIHRGAWGDIVVEQWTLHGAGHAWSGGDARGSHTDRRGPAASEEIWRFFEQHERRPASARRLAPNATWPSCRLVPATRSTAPY